MTFEMILALSILILMIVLIMTDKMAFGAPPLLACMLLVITGLSTVQEAFAGFVNSSVIMVAGFMVVLAAVEKTSLLGKVKSAMETLVDKGGYKSYVLLLVIVMIGASLAGTGSTGYYVLILSLVSTIPYSEKLPTSKLMMPLGFATNHPLVPFNVALHFGIIKSVLEAAGDKTNVSMVKVSIVSLILSLGFLVWSLVAYKLLPDHTIAEASIEAKEMKNAKEEQLPAWKEWCTVIAFFIVFVFALLTSTCATFTGSNMGSVYIFAPIAISACMSLGLNPVAAAVAVVISGWNGGYMPIDGMPAMILGMGNYKMSEFWKFSVPMYIIRILALSLGAILVFPM